MQQFLELLKYTIPGFIVFATAYYLLKAYFDDNYRMQALRMKSEAQKVTLPVRLQAYERLMLLCERMNLTNVLLRVRTPDMTVADLRMAMMVAMNQEFDHNTSQQLYVSETLWQIMQVAKQDALSSLMKAGEDVDPQADSDLLIANLFRLQEAKGIDPLQKAQQAIRTEAGQLF
jgi:hypothetical protein